MKKKTIGLCVIFILVIGGVLGCMNQESITGMQTQDAIRNNNKVQEVIEKNEEGVEKDIEKDALDAYIEKLSLEEKIGQLFIVALNDEIDSKTLVETYHVGGIVLFKKDIISSMQVQALIQDLQGTAEIPLWIAIDEEGGRVSRVGSNIEMVEQPFKSAYEIGQTQDTNLAYQEAKKMGKVLKNLGINMNFAPVADIYNNAQNKVIGNRSFGHTQEEVTPMVIAFAKGLKEEGIFPVVKHFPGHGNTYQDSHEELAYIDKSLVELEREEFIPFQEAMKQGVEGMMIGHLVVKEVDALPATLSKVWGAYIKEHFDTSEVLLITDAMNMGAVVQNKEAGVAAVESFISGMDIILMPDHLAAAEAAMKKAYEEKKITPERLNESVKKILLKKVEQNLLVLE